MACRLCDAPDRGSPGSQNKPLRAATRREALPVRRTYSVQALSSDAAGDGDLRSEAAQRAGVTGKDVTPFLLAWFHERTEGASLRANVALVLSNARLAAEIAVAGRV